MKNQNHKTEPKQCEMCVKNLAIRGERYCKTCRKIKLSEMKDAGYLTSRPIGHVGQSRTSEMKELQYETKWGI